MRVAYLVNQYPQPSHTFIRREIAALEADGLHISRYTLRRPTTPLVDPDDRAEQDRVRAVLDKRPLGIAAACLRVLLTRPARFLAAWRLAWKIGRRSDRGRTIQFAYLAEACVLLDWLRRERIDHVHAHFGTNSVAVAMLCHALGGPPYSFTVHGPEEFDKPEFLHLGEKIARAAFVVAISEFGRSQLWRWCPLGDWDKIHVVHCGLDREFLDGELTPPPDERRLVCVARLHEQKGLLNLVRAARRVLDEAGPFELIIAGDGPLRGEIEALVRTLGLERVVRLVGWKSNAEVRAEIRAARALVLASFAEGLPVVIMESLAMGRPVISTAVAGVGELVSRGECGWLVPAGAVEPLAKAMVAALAAPVNELARLGAEGARQVKNEHDARREAKKLRSLFEKTSQNA